MFETATQISSLKRRFQSWKASFLGEQISLQPVEEKQILDDEHVANICGSTENR